jgi:outer membrane protein OmpA-like peptidoglycan-associated protein
MLVVALFAIAALLPAASAEAGLKDRFKKTVDKAGQKAGEAADKAVGDAEGTIPGGSQEAEATQESGEASDAGDSEGAAAGAGSSTRVSDVSTKFDFVPGDKVLFADDFTQDELGEFPAHWALKEGTFEVAELKGERWLRCTSDDSHIRMKMPPSLPEFWTLEFDLLGADMGGPTLLVSGYSETGSEIWQAYYPHDKNLAFRCGDIHSTTPNPTPVTSRHHVMFMARGTALKVYMDRERLANVPDVTGRGTPAEFDFRLWAGGKPDRLMITNVRFAEGCKPAKDMLADGKLVTYGIFFDSGSDVVKPESAPVLRQIAAYLEANPAVKLAITGHTDNTGTAAGNLDLSKRRAASVARVLSEDFKIAADRFTSDGKGDTESVATNDTAEGRAMNRRVEFKKA